MRLDRKFKAIVTKMKDGSLVPEDQLMVFLAKDDAVPATLRAYRAECERLGAGRPQLDSVDRLIADVDRWRAEHPGLCKVPDVHPGEVDGGDEAPAPEASTSMADRPKGRRSHFATLKVDTTVFGRLWLPLEMSEEDVDVFVEEMRSVLKQLVLRQEDEGP